MRRVVVVGNSASGKTTLAGALSRRLGVAHVELDAHHHLAGWVPAPRPEMVAAVGAALDDADAEHGGWVVCGNYSAVRSLVWARADTIVWLDMPRRVVMRRVAGRSLRRVAGRQVLWNGNRESLANVLALGDPERSIVRWTWDGVIGYRRRYTALRAAATWPELRWVHLSSPGQVRRWLAGVPRAPGAQSPLP